MFTSNLFLTTLISCVVLTSSCQKEPINNNSNFLTENVVIIVMDGARYSETWGDSTHQYIPYLSELSSTGVMYTNFRNNGPTYTSAGHTAITTGHYQEIDNGGNELPTNPSIFQHWIQTHNKPNSLAWVITSKGKLNVLSNCTDDNWNDNYRPKTDCGNDGSGSGYRDDSITFLNSIDNLALYKPQLVLINFREPDYSGHSGNWDNYIKGIKDVDSLIYQLWSFMENDPYYGGTTTLFVTNDHGRHLDGIKDGYISHGDNCEGCRHINLFAIGPDFKKNYTVDIEREQIDIPATISKLMNFEMPKGEGKIMSELFK